MDVEALKRLADPKPSASLNSAVASAFEREAAIAGFWARRYAIIAALEHAERLDDAIRDALDVAVGFARTMSADEKVEHMKAILEAALATAPTEEGG